MERTFFKNRNLIAAFALAVILHGLLLTIPAARKAVIEAVSTPAVTVRLTRPVPVMKTPVQPEEIIVVSSPAPLPAPEKSEPQTPPIKEPVPAEPASAASARLSASRILLDLEERRKADPLAFLRPADEKAPEFRIHSGPVLDEVLKEPSLQLPFEDTRIYLVDSYDPGLAGGIERFFDNVTVPFGFTTKNNTRIQCAWILIVAGCSWGDVSYYAAKDQARKRR
ncbi:MAG: hypothetical protein V2I79_10150 [Xanthomonadales bacterium]|jgi:hypothetical protein|nr:hypothetical protein [Xanthomonadales bacterium]